MFVIFGNVDSRRLGDMVVQSHVATVINRFPLLYEEGKITFMGARTGRVLVKKDMTHDAGNRLTFNCTGRRGEYEVENVEMEAVYAPESASGCCTLL